MKCEAVQLRWDTWSEMCELADVGRLEDGKPSGCYVDLEDKPTREAVNSRMGLAIPTPDGVLLAVEYDWVIREPDGQLRICRLVHREGPLKLPDFLGKTMWERLLEPV